MLTGSGKFINRKGVTDSKKYDRFFAYIPTEVARDSAFPLNDGDRIKVTIEKKKVVLEKFE